jgi:serine/threonine-protein kinase
MTQPSITSDHVERFGKYLITRRLGIGGMAEVFLCRLPGIGGFDKAVVVKRILPDLIEDPNFVDMFLDEARVAANLNHPNIAQVFEIDHIDQVPYIAMEYVQGPSLSQLLKGARKVKKLHVGHVAKLLSGAAAGLHYAHNARDSDGQPLQIVHRDVSPQNILVSLDGVTKLVDFGVARARGRLATTEAGTIKGKIRYMAPEQVLGKEFDSRADIFAFGVCLYFATTGQYPFVGENDVETMRAACTGEFTPPSSLVDDYPPRLEEIVASTLQADPAKRAQTAEDVHNALEDFVGDGEYASSTKAVAAWLREIFPNFEEMQMQVSTGTVSKPSGATPLSGQFPHISSGPRSRSGTSTSNAAAPAPSQGPWRLVAFVGLGIALLLTLVFALKAAPPAAPPVAADAPKSPSPPPTSAPVPSPAAPVVASAPAVSAASASSPAPPPAVSSAALEAPPAKTLPHPAYTFKSPAHAAKAAQPSPPPTATPPPAATPTARPCTNSWTPDSPLPPC